MTGKKVLTAVVVLLSFLTAGAQVSLDSCRHMALRNNKDLLIAKEKINQANYQKKEALAAYFPQIDVTAGYMYNSEEISMFSEDQLLPIKTFNSATGGYEFNLVTHPGTGKPIIGPNGKPIPSAVALIPKEAMTFDIHNVFGGAVTIKQPIFMGGKIVAMNKITRYAEQIAKDMHDKKVEDIIYNVDAAYWQVVSLSAKHELASSYVALLDTLYRNIEAVKNEGMATKSEVLSVAVKLNSAQVDLARVENGLALSRMALNQICGLHAEEVYKLADEGKTMEISELVASQYNMADVYARRKDVHALQTAVKVYEQKQNVALAGMLPNIAVVGSYSMTNPNLFNGFSKKLDGMFSVGAMITIPICHSGGRYHKYRAAESEKIIKQYELQDAMEKIELQVSQASFKVQESVKRYNMTKLNIDNAVENLRQAELGFKEGMLTADDVMKAQTAWLKAGSEVVDAGVEVQLCKMYLSKVLGEMGY